MAGGSDEADEEDRIAGREPGSTVVVSEFEDEEPQARGVSLRQPEVVFVAVICALATVALGIYPDPLFDVARDAGTAITSLL
jgi:NADH-quinone oxidoreductase subunit N